MPKREDYGMSAWAVDVPEGYRVGQWEVISGIATGSWGSVYEARRLDSTETDLGTLGKIHEHNREYPDRVALKFLPTGTLSPRQINHLADMAKREIGFSRNHGSSHLVATLDTLVVDDPSLPELDGAVVLVMERASHSLQALLDATPRGTPLSEAPQMIGQICAALVQMHATGWVHGDLKPANVLVFPDGSLRLADFGLAAELEGTHAYAPPSGSLDYLPPERRDEQLSGRGVITRTSGDIWALGVTVHQILTGGAYPFPGATVRARVAAARAYADGRAELRLADGVPPAWRRFIADCLAPGHGPRAHHDAESLLARARTLAETDPAFDTEFRADRTPHQARAGGPGARRWTRARRWRPRRALPAALCGVALLTTGGAEMATGVESGTSQEAGRAHGGHARAVAATAAGYRPDLLRTDAGVPPRYRRVIIAAGSTCKEPGVSPVLVAAMLAAESGFNPNLADPQKNEYGIARWTPRVLKYYLPGGGPQAPTPKPPFSAKKSILSLGRYLCYKAPVLAHVRGNDALKLAAAFRTSADTIVTAEGIPDRLRPYTNRVRHYMGRFTPRDPGMSGRPHAAP